MVLGFGILLHFFAGWLFKLLPFMVSENIPAGGKCVDAYVLVRDNVVGGYESFIDAKLEFRQKSVDDIKKDLGEFGSKAAPSLLKEKTR